MIRYFLDILNFNEEVNKLSSNKNISKMSSHHPERHFNIGVFFFFIIFIYLGFNIVTYFTTNTMAVYEVGQGTIATNHVYQGLILRDESIVFSTRNGYVNYYFKNGTKAAVNDTVYSVDTNGAVSKRITKAATDGSTLNKAMLKNIADEILLFRNYYHSNDYEMVSSFYDSLSSELTQTLNMNALNSLSKVVNSAEAKNTFYRNSAGEAGIIVYYTDGYENTTPDNFTSAQMSQATYTKKVLDDQTQVKTGDPVYKRINSEEWNLLIEVSDVTAKQLSDSKNIKIRICKDDFTLNVPFSIFKNDGKYYLNLMLKTAMIRYVDERFLDVELVISEDFGLKIPKSAITSKQFYTIPKKYFMQGESNHKTLLVERRDEQNNILTTELEKPTIYYETEKFYYVDDEFVQAGDSLIRADSVDAYIVGTDVDSLVGVYNINKGYAVFKQINILSQNDDYAIVETKTPYGLSLYDHIALNGSKVKENQLMKD